jgi:hypothetical protein
MLVYRRCNHGNRSAGRASREDEIGRSCRGVVRAGCWGGFNAGVNGGCQGEVERRDACAGVKMAGEKLELVELIWVSRNSSIPYQRYASCKCLAHLRAPVEVDIMHQVRLAATALTLVICFDEIVHFLLTTKQPAD